MQDFEYMTPDAEEQSATLKLPNTSREYVNITPFTRSRSSSRNLQPRRKLTLMEKIGVWNLAVTLVGSLLVLGVLGFLWFLV
jgi:hypothetical protein